VTRDQRWIAGFAIGLLVHVAATGLMFPVGRRRGLGPGLLIGYGAGIALFGGTFTILALGSA
jgi:hypothetical protein